ncbi:MULTISPECIES: hypothetical protein [Streptomyces]|uniref:Uncharacterized protein n=1 Tax=Streptomyces lichenis TaxID=2306967 RepID=A0ABT0IFN7_9ACTN|nr:hypothetical protein [Streptomyces lichenis]MCK8680072.1 hypothetical protein [Streptomyces lichenis]
MIKRLMRAAAAAAVIGAGAIGVLGAAEGTGSYAVDSVVAQQQDPGWHRTPTSGAQDPGWHTAPASAQQDPGWSTAPAVVRDPGWHRAPATGQLDPGWHTAPAVASAVTDPGWHVLSA